MERLIAVEKNCTRPRFDTENEFNSEMACHKTCPCFAPKPVKLV